MTIRRRLSLSFLAILVLFAMNLAVYFWSNYRRDTTMDALRRAVSRQNLISTLSQTLHDVHKQVTLLSQLATEAAASGASPAEVARFTQHLQEAGAQIEQLRDLSEPEMRSRVDTFAQAYHELSESWTKFYRNMGVHHSEAIVELAVRGEPLSQRFMNELLPRLQQDEQRRVEAATANFHQIARVTNRITVFIFALSAVLAALIAFRVARYLNQALGELKKGAREIGAGHLNSRIKLRSRDELAELAAAFNDMTERLYAAREDLTRAHEEEKKKSLELSNALEQLRRAQDQLMVQQKLASLGALTAGIAHEIKNPLNFVTNFAELSAELVQELHDTVEAEKPRLDPRHYAGLEEGLAALKQNVSKITQHGKRADGIVRNMLAHSRGHGGQREPTNINNLVSEYVKLAYHGMRAQDSDFNISIEEEYDGTLPPVDAVAQDLSRVFLNIANNACFATHQKRKRLGNGFSPTLRVSTRDVGDAVEIRLRDNGEGVRPEIQKRIFEPFFTTKPAGSGTGLGLSMSYDIITQEHKGQIRLESEPEQFAEFIITLPKQVPA